MPLDMKKIFLFIMISYCCVAQSDNVCDSISITINDYDSINNTVNIQVNVEYYSSYIFPYAGFMITNETDDIIASESLESAANVYGLSSGMSENRVLDLNGNASLTGSSTIHLVSYLFAGTPIVECSWPFYYPEMFTNIPDDNFEQYLISEGLDNTLDNYVLTNNINSVTELELSGLEIFDLTGIEAFTALESLNCSETELSELNIDNNNLLTYLNCSSTNISDLDLDNNTSLLNLDCSNNSILDLDLSSNNSIINLDCSNNNISDLDLNNNLSMQSISCNQNNLSQLDLSSNTLLNSIFCQNNNIECVQVASLVYANINTQDFIKDDSAIWSEDCNYPPATPFQGIIVEEIENNNNVDGQTYRLYAKINEGRLNGYWANENNDSYIQSSTNFYVDQANLWGNLPDEIENKKVQRGIDTTIFDNTPSSEFTSWLTLGDSYNSGTTTCPYNAVFHKSQNFNLGVSEDGTEYLLKYNGTDGESGFVKLAETNYNYINSNYMYYSSDSENGWFPYAGNPNGLVQGEYCESTVAYPDENNLVLLFQMTTTGSICGLINLEGEDANGNPWSESGIDFLIANGNLTNCDGECITDLDDDLICDEIDECVGEFDECGTCNGNGPELYYDCNWNCINDADGDGWCDEIEIEGCFDPVSCNYNLLATDIICIYPEEGFDCDEVCILDLDEDGICDPIDECVGEFDECGDCNGNGPELYYDCNWNCINDSDGDGTCDEYEIIGCMDSNACNYNSAATDDDLCEYANTCAYGSGTWMMENYPGPEATIYATGENWSLSPTTLSYETSNIGWYTAVFEDGQLISDCYTGPVNIYIEYNTSIDSLGSTSIIGDIIFTISNSSGASAVSVTTVSSLDLLTGTISGGIESFSCETCSGETDGTGFIINNDTNNNGVCDDDEAFGCTYEMACNYLDVAITDDGSCEFPGDECILPGSLGPDFDYGIFNSDCECVENNTGLIEQVSSKRIIAIIDVLGRAQAADNKGMLFLYIFDDGSIEKTYITK
tara:strand:- start:2015 stop:5041 length:3027 start_codon:yes stop_codon:yes gene_type:complete